MESWSEVESLKSRDHLPSGDLRSLQEFRFLKLSLLHVTVVPKRSGLVFEKRASKRVPASPFCSAGTRNSDARVY